MDSGWDCASDGRYGYVPYPLDRIEVLERMDSGSDCYIVAYWATTKPSVVVFLNCHKLPMNPPNSSTPEPSCENCKYWEADDDEDQDNLNGTCRRHAPKVVGSSGGVFLVGVGFLYGNQDTEWPDTEAFDWCGEYEGRCDD